MRNVCLGIILICPLVNQTHATDQETVRQEIARLRSEVSERLKRISELEGQLGPAHLRLEFDGYCPVTVIDEERWVLGSSDHQVVSKGRVYYFASAQQMLKFERSPEKYTPVMGGCDPVLWIENGERTIGRREHGLIWKGRIVLCASEESLERFFAEPTRYVNAEQIRSWETTAAENAPDDSHDPSAAVEAGDKDRHASPVRRALRYRHRRCRMH